VTVALIDLHSYTAWRESIANADPNDGFLSLTIDADDDDETTDVRSSSESDDAAPASAAVWCS